MSLDKNKSFVLNRVFFVCVTDTESEQNNHFSFSLISFGRKLNEKK